MKKGKTIIETIKDVKYNSDYNEYYNPDERNYAGEYALGPKDICCRLCIVAPQVYPTGTMISHQPVTNRVVGPPPTDSSRTGTGLDLFDFAADIERRPDIRVDSEHQQVKLYVEPGLPGFDLPIVWDDDNEDGILV